MTLKSLGEGAGPWTLLCECARCVKGHHATPVAQHSLGSCSAMAATCVELVHAVHSSYALLLHHHLVRIWRACPIYLMSERGICDRCEGHCRWVWV